MDSEVDIMQQTIQDLEQASDLIYMPDPDPNKIPINRNLTRKAGYLNTRKYESLSAGLWFSSSTCIIRCLSVVDLI